MKMILKPFSSRVLIICCLIMLLHAQTAVSTGASDGVENGKRAVPKNPAPRAPTATDTSSPSTSSPPAHFAIGVGYPTISPNPRVGRPCNYKIRCSRHPPGP